MRVFVVGFPKSGTSTLTKAFEEQGLSCAHWVVPGKGYCGKLLYESYNKGEDPFTDFDGISCITQADVLQPKSGLNFWPNLDFKLIRSIQDWHPECKFLLNRRNVPSLIDSITRWGSFRRRLTKANIIGLPRGVGSRDQELEAWISGHYEACCSHFQENENFLDFSIEDPEARKKIGTFIGVNLTWWGVENKNQHWPSNRGMAAAAVS